MYPSTKRHIQNKVKELAEKIRKRRAERMEVFDWLVAEYAKQNKGIDKRDHSMQSSRSI